MAVKNKQKLYINGRFLTQSISGVQRYAYEFVAALDRMIEQQNPVTQYYDFILLKPQKLNPAYDINFQHISVRSVGAFSGHLWEQMELPFYAMNGILFCPGNTAPLIHMWSKQKTIVTVHDLSFRYFPEAYSMPFKILYYILTPFVMRYADLVITVSKSEYDSILNLYPVVQGRLKAVQNGGLPDRFLNLLDTIPAYDELQPYILYVGALNPRKNPQGVIAALNLIRKKTKINLLVIGSAGKSFTQLVYEQSNHNRGELIFTGQVDHTEKLIAYYKGAVCFVFPSFYEASPLPPIEAMSCSCPVIAGDIISLRERCAEAALYCNPNAPEDISDKIQSVIENKEICNQLIQAGLDRSRDFTWHECVAQTLNLIQPYN